MSPLGVPVFLAAAKSTGYQIGQSLRFNSGDSTYLNWTPSSAGDRTLWTWSAWIKRSGLSSTVGLFGSYAANNNNDYLEILFASGNTLLLQGYNTSFLNTTQVFRDTSAWYHIVIAVDTSNATADDRIKIYVNGEQVTDFATRNNPSSGSNLGVNQAGVHRLGRRPDGTDYFNGYMADVNFIDGAALGPDSFGKTNVHGVWTPVGYAGSYTGNSFYLRFASGDGTDSSGLSNTWTANNVTTSGTGTDVMSDTPTTNWCTLNPISVTANLPSGYAKRTPYNGNLGVSFGQSAGGIDATFAITPNSGKFYWEVQVDTSGSNQSTTRWGVLLDGSNYDIRNTQDISSVSNGDVLGFALDANAGTINYYLNGTLQGSDPYQTFPSGWELAVPWMGVTSNGSRPQSEYTFNFGQRDFAYTPPTGFKALNTKNLPAPTVKDGSDYFNTVLWTGNATARDITTGHNSNFTWIKHRSSAENHNLYDILRGTGVRLESNSTDSDTSYSDRLTAFNSDGFSLGTGYNNTNGTTYVGWSWAGGGSGSSISTGSVDGTNPTIASTVSANASAGFSIVTYTGNGTTGATVGHGLGVAPEMIIIKQRTGTFAWRVYHKDLGNTNAMFLNLTNASTTDSAAWNNTSPTSSVITFGNSQGVNGSSSDYVAYCFAEVEGYSKFGYVSGLNNDEFVYLGFSPSWIMFKRTSDTSNWAIRDSKRDTYNITSKSIDADTSSAESTFAALDFLSNGFKARSFTGASGGWIYAAFAENPFGGSGVSPATAR